MTNSSPQEPQNPVPERRKRPAAGVTFDEMIAIVVAFSTIGAILFWSLGGKRGSIASNLGLGGNSSSLLSTGEDVAVKITDPNGNVKFGELESESANIAVASNSGRVKSVPLAAPSGNLNVASGIQSQSYGFDRAKKYAPLAGVAAIPALTNNSDINIKVDENINTGQTYTESIGGETEDTDTKEPVATTPDKPENTDTKEPVAIAPKKVETPQDIDPDYWAYPFVKSMSMNKKLKIAEFADDANFEPDKLITRAGMATLISQAFDMKPGNENIKKFKDVPNKNALAADVDKAVRTGFMQGYSDDEFRPLENIPRYQVLVTLATGLGLKPSQDPEAILQKFDDSADFPDWAKEQVAAATEAGLVVNSPETADNVLDPNKSATRAEVAAMIHQALVQNGTLEPLDSDRIVKP